MNQFKCNLCNKHFNSLVGLSGHIRQFHYLSRQEYYINYISHDKKCGICSICGLSAKFINIRDGYSKTCGSKECGFQQHKITMKERYGCEHSMQSKQLYEKRQKNNMLKYGVKNVSQIENVKDNRKSTWKSKSKEQIEQSNSKRQNTCIERYGSRWITQTEWFKLACKSTCLKRYGVEHSFQSAEVKDKIKNSYIVKYGYQYAGQVPSIRQKMQNTCIQRYGTNRIMSLPEFKLKRKLTWLKIYGVDNPSKSQEIKDKKRVTYFAKYGVQFPSQNLTVKLKCMQNRKFQYKMPIKRFMLKCERQIHYQSKPELDFILQCENLDIDIYDGPVIPYQFNGKPHHYFSDFIIKNPISNNWRIVEIKANHPYHIEDVKSGRFNAKCSAAIEFSAKMNYDPYIVVFY